jgi:hypothetical protein
MAQRGGAMEKIGFIGTIFIGEDHFEIGADLTRCASAFVASILKYFVQAGLKHSRFSQNKHQMVKSSLDRVFA